MTTYAATVARSREKLTRRIALIATVLSLGTLSGAGTLLIAAPPAQASHYYCGHSTHYYGGFKDVWQSTTLTPTSHIHRYYHYYYNLGWYYSDAFNRYC